jgi:hypothetical protein
MEHSNSLTVSITIYCSTVPCNMPTALPLALPYTTVQYRAICQQPYHQHHHILQYSTVQYANSLTISINTQSTQNITGQLQVKFRIARCFPSRCTPLGVLSNRFLISPCFIERFLQLFSIKFLRTVHS